jgi:hypothetical protein
MYSAEVMKDHYRSRTVVRISGRSDDQGLFSLVIGNGNRVEQGSLTPTSNFPKAVEDGARAETEIEIKQRGHAKVSSQLWRG